MTYLNMSRQAHWIFPAGKKGEPAGTLPIADILCCCAQVIQEYWCGRTIGPFLVHSNEQIQAR